MPLTVSDLFGKINLIPSKPYKWGERIPSRAKGIYVISTSNDPNKNILLNQFELNKEVFNTWKIKSPYVALKNGKLDMLDFQEHLNSFWHKNETYCI
jgi:hypothetical protein